MSSLPGGYIGFWQSTFSRHSPTDRCFLDIALATQGQPINFDMISSLRKQVWLWSNMGRYVRTAEEWPATAVPPGSGFAFVSQPRVCLLSPAGADPEGRALPSEVLEAIHSWQVFDPDSQTEVWDAPCGQRPGEVKDVLRLLGFPGVLVRAFDTPGSDMLNQRLTPLDVPNSFLPPRLIEPIP